MVDRELILKSLASVEDIGGGGDIVSAGRVREIVVDNGSVRIVLHLPTDDRKEKFRIEDEARAVSKALEGVTDVMVVTRGARTLEKPKEPPSSRAGSEPRNPFLDRAPIEGIERIVAVASGKGGVGKSTVCVNLALALAQTGVRVGLLDADIYGPSLKVLLGVDSRPAPGTVKEILPVEEKGLKLMSLAFITDPETPVIWRGPIVAGVMKKFLNDVEWGELDYLLVDLPPGTGDAQLTLVQTVPLDGAIIVTTPSELALVDAEKGLRMFLQLDVPVIGIVENMSYYSCPHCGERSYVFSRGGGRRVGEKYSTALLGEIPLDPSLRESGDGGNPVVVSQPDSPVAKAFSRLAEAVTANCPVAPR